MARVGANDLNSTAPTDDAALVADSLDAWFYLHDDLIDDLWQCRLVRASPTLRVGVPNDVSLAGARLLVPICDATAAEVVGGQFDLNTVSWKDADVVHPHLAAYVGQHAVPVVEFNSEHRSRKWLDDLSFQDDHIVFGFRQCLSPRR